MNVDFSAWKFDDSGFNAQKNGGDEHVARTGTRDLR
jgi:hypothetical protein